MGCGRREQTDVHCVLFTAAAVSFLALTVSVYGLKTRSRSHCLSVMMGVQSEVEETDGATEESDDWLLYTVVGDVFGMCRWAASSCALCCRSGRSFCCGVLSSICDDGLA